MSIKIVAGSEMGIPESGVTVQLFDPSLVASAITDSNGEATFAAVYSNFAVIRYEKSGFTKGSVRAADNVGIILRSEGDQVLTTTQGLSKPVPTNAVGEIIAVPGPTPTPSSGDRVVATYQENGIGIMGVPWTCGGQSGSTDALGQVVITVAGSVDLVILGSEVDGLGDGESVTINVEPGDS